MRILLCTETYFPILNGIVTFVEMLAKVWTSQGHDVLIVAPDHTARRHHISHGVLHCPAVKSEQLLVDLSLPIDAVRYRKVRAFKPDVIHIQAEWGISLFGLKTAQYLKVPLVYTLHTEYSKFFTYAVKPFMIPWATSTFAYIERYIAKHATIITSPSKKGQKYFEALGTEVHVEVIQNSVELDDFDPLLFSEEDKRKLRDSLGIAEHQKCALFVGRMGPEKSVDVLLEYWAESIRAEHNLRLVLIGGGPEDENLRNRSKKLGLESQVIFCGKIPHAQIGLYYAICDFYVTASLSEMHSVAMLEGLGSGLPVIQRLDPLNADQLQEGVNGYFFTSAQEFGGHLLSLNALDAKDMAELKRKVRESVLHTNSPKALAEKYLTQYEKAIRLYRRKPSPPEEA
ncbi:MAG: glycosyltransferase family 4 protein [Spirochaetae bacterium HGW-Spirochaetae-2]|nr:MAG: glycosyltransferase family 4 protein [Spirochaetae bacterium HGW-Spirochaetae-2]